MSFIAMPAAQAFADGRAETGCVPAAQMGALLGYRQFDPPREIYRNQRRNVGNAVARAGDEFAFRQSRIHLREEAAYPQTATFGQRRNLLVVVRPRQRAPLEAGRSVPQRIHAGVKAVAFGNALPRGDHRLLFGGLSHQRRMRLDRFEIHADADGVSNPRAVVEFEHRHGSVGIDCPKRRRQLLIVAQIDLHRRHADAFLGEEDAHAARARSRDAVVELHQTPPPGHRPAIRRTADAVRAARPVPCGRNARNSVRD